MGFVFACGYCETPLKGLAKPSSDSLCQCPSCGQTDTFENVKGIVAEALKESARSKIEDMLRAAARPGWSLTYSDAPRSKGAYRFIAVEIDEKYEAYRCRGDR